MSPPDLRGSHPELQEGPRSTWLRQEESIWGRSMLLGRPSMLRHHQGQHHVLLSTRHHCGSQLQGALGSSSSLHRPYWRRKERLSLAQHSMLRPIVSRCSTGVLHQSSSKARLQENSVMLLQFRAGLSSLLAPSASSQYLRR